MVASKKRIRLDKGKGRSVEKVDKEATKEGTDEESSKDEDSESHSENEGASSSDDGEDQDDDFDDIVQANEDAQTKPKKKRKRALPQAAFGSLLSSLISAPLPTKPLKPLHPPPSEEALEKKALKLLQARKHEREERGHVADVIGGWTPRPNVPFSQWNRIVEGASTEYATGGAEKEKELRKLAQKGAVRLFNAIKAAQTTDQTGLAAPSASRPAAIKEEARRSTKEASPAGSVSSSIVSQKPGISTDIGRANLLGTRGKQEALANLSKASFLDLFKKPLSKA